MGITESQSVHKTEGRSPSPGREEEPGQEEGGRDVERELSPARQTLGRNASLLSPVDGFLSSGTLPERLLLPVCLTRAPARSPSCICHHRSCRCEPDPVPHSSVRGWDSEHPIQKATPSPLTLTSLNTEVMRCSWKTDAVELWVEDQVQRFRRRMIKLSQFSGHVS